MAAHRRQLDEAAAAPRRRRLDDLLHGVRCGRALGQTRDQRLEACDRHAARGVPPLALVAQVPIAHQRIVDSLRRLLSHQLRIGARVVERLLARGAEPLLTVGELLRKAAAAVGAR
eukprot:3291384-Prymnesium_polylepis.1